MNCAYVRVSTAEQNEARQIEALEKYDIEKWFTEKVSGKDMNRPQLQAMLDYVREGDTVYVHDFSRLARNTADLFDITNRLTEKGVQLVSLKEAIDTHTPQGKLMLTMIAAINEFERDIIKQRQGEGIAIAKAAGKYKGRQRIKAEKAFDEAYARYLRRDLSKAAMARELGVSRPTLDRMIKEKLEG